MANPRRGPRRPARIGPPVLPVPAHQRLYVACDAGDPVTVDGDGALVDGGEGFLRQNAEALAKLDVRAALEPGRRTVALKLHPGGRAGAVPLRSPRTGLVDAGLVVRPRFGWPGMGRVLEQTGWQGAPEMLSLPLVPGSGREVPPWVLAGPVLRRLRELLAHLRRGYRMAEEELPTVRGHVAWDQYASRSLPAGTWHLFPCRFPELGHDPELRAEVRWALEKLRGTLLGVAGHDPLALRLAEEALALIGLVADVQPRRPAPAGRVPRAVHDPLLQAGLQALGWVADERGLGGQADLHGLAWTSPLEELWERYAEGVVRQWAALVGGTVSTARERTALVPVRWRQPSGTSFSHLAPDVVVRTGRRIVVFDAKYKAHLSTLDAAGWRSFTEGEHAAHRADVHQVLAYAALFDAEVVTSVLVYPLPLEPWLQLSAAGRTLALADVGLGGRAVRLGLAGLPFGTIGAMAPLWKAWRDLLTG